MTRAPVDAAPDTGGPLAPWLAIVLVVGTSAAVLVLEILAGRLMAPYVGVSLDTYTGIIGTILAGIAVGAWAGGALADRVDPRRLIPPMLVLGGALGTASIPIVRAVGSVGGDGTGPRILVLAGLGFLPSATVLSAVPPAVVKLQLRDLGATGVTVGRLSAYGTAGAIAGTFLTGFVLVSWAAVTTLIVAVGLLLVFGGVALAVAWWRRGVRPRGLGATSALAAVSLVGVVAVDAPCDVQTAYYCVSVVADTERPSGRTLVLDDLRHSYVDLDDPTHLEFWYVRRIVDAIDLTHPQGPVDAVHVGGGAFTVPRYVQATRPESAQTVFEIDGDLVDAVAERLGDPRGDGIEVITGDARLSMRDVPDGVVDVVVGDAFGGRAVPWHLATREFAAEVDRVLRPGGVYVINVIDGAERRFLRAEAATIAAEFDHVFVVLGPAAASGGRGNSVIVASDAPLPRDALARLATRDDGRPVDDLDEFLDTFADGVDVLTDDFAPVDQLIAGGA